MQGRLQKIAAALACMSAVSVTAAPQAARPTTAVPVAAGWTARFFVSPTTPRANLLGEPLRGHELGVNARLAKRLAPGLQLSVDLSNLFDRPSPATGNLLAPAAGRGARIGLRKTF